MVYRRTAVERTNRAHDAPSIPLFRRRLPRFWNMIHIVNMNMSTEKPASQVKHHITGEDRRERTVQHGLQHSGEDPCLAQGQHPGLRNRWRELPREM